MKLDENFTLENDQNQWILYYEKVSDKKTDKGEFKVSKNQTYYPNIEFALIAYCDKALKPCESVIEVLDAIEVLHDKIKGKFEMIISEQL